MVLTALSSTAPCIGRFSIAQLVFFLTAVTTYVCTALLACFRTPGTTYVSASGRRAGFRSDHSLAARKAALTLRLHLTAAAADTAKDGGCFLLLRCLTCGSTPVFLYRRPVNP